MSGRASCFKGITEPWQTATSHGLSRTWLTVCSPKGLTYPTMRQIASRSLPLTLPARDACASRPLSRPIVNLTLTHTTLSERGMIGVTFKVGMSLRSKASAPPSGRNS